ncbi:Uncharacterised protein [Paraprevotella clara]|uniref:DNA (cytosine-5-)-methyltransferase n=1 Tax=Paraprevotella clara TaxID=454154 RepID=A0A6N3EU97_9BACT
MQSTIQTSQGQIFPNGEGESMYSPEGSLASPSVWPDKEKEWMITVTSGLKCSGLYGKYCHVGSLVRMLLESSRWYSPVRRLKWEVRPLYSERITEKEYCTDKNMLSKPFVETLNVKDTPSNRYLFRLVPSERRTEGIEFGLLPTVQTQGLKRCNSQGKTEFMPLELLPTPMATDIHHAERVAELKKRGAKGLRCRDKGEAGANGLTDWMDFHGLLPTPVASDKNTGTTKDRKDGISRMSNLKKQYSSSIWEKFPTESPICSGDDGISGRLDGITFSKWRQESVKAYGNAIVPQVAYEIFKAIELCR